MATSITTKIRARRYTQTFREALARVEESTEKAHYSRTSFFVPKGSASDPTLRRILLSDMPALSTDLQSKTIRLCSDGAVTCSVSYNSDQAHGDTALPDQILDAKKVLFLSLRCMNLHSISVTNKSGEDRMVDVLVFNQSSYTLPEPYFKKFPVSDLDAGAVELIGDITTEREDFLVSDLDVGAVGLVGNVSLVYRLASDLDVGAAELTSGISLAYELAGDLNIDVAELTGEITLTP